MRFPDRPLVTAGLGVAFALLILVALSTPALFQGVVSPQDNAVLVSTNSVTQAATTSTSVPYLPSSQNGSSLQVNSETSRSVPVALASTISGSTFTNLTPATTFTQSSTEAATTNVQSSTAQVTTVAGTTVASSAPDYIYGKAASQAGSSSLYLSAGKLTIIGIVALVLALAASVIMYRKVNSGEK